VSGKPSRPAEAVTNQPLVPTPATDTRRLPVGEVRKVRRIERELLDHDLTPEKLNSQADQSQGEKSFFILGTKTDEQGKANQTPHQHATGSAEGF
jgi:hypothetical protein